VDAAVAGVAAASVGKRRLGNRVVVVVVVTVGTGGTVVKRWNVCIKTVADSHEEQKAIVRC